MILLMKLALWISAAAAALAFGLTSCGNGGRTSAGNQQPGIGPFDSQGRYRDEWADNPSMWRRPGSTKPPKTNDEVPKIAQNEQPPMNSVPLASASQPKPTIAETKAKSSSSSQEVTVKTPPHPKSGAETVKSKTKPKSEPTIVKAKPKPKAVVKAKPKATRYVVKSGDSLSKIASRHGTSVSAIQRQNGISGTMIHPGQSLTIPK